MKLFWVVIFLVFYSGFNISEGVNSTLSPKPDVVNIGCMLIFATPVGKVTKLAIDAAVDDVNSDPDVLGGTNLNISTLDSASGFVGIVEAIRFMETETVAIIGPQSSVIAHVIAHIANELQVPLLSFAAADPTLTSLQFPFFIRTSPNDLFQMAAISSIVEYYEWSEVIAIYIDDDYGRNGITALGDQLAMKRCKISYKAALKPNATIDDFKDALVQVALMESRVLVVHVYPDEKFLGIFSVAKSLRMTESGYVWITTHWLTTIIDTVGPLSVETMESLQGVVTLRTHIPESELKRKFVSRWSNMTQSSGADGRLGLCTFGLYAYDTVWLLARALDAFFKKGGRISFSEDPRLEEKGGGLHFNSMSIFNGGNLLREIIFETEMIGVTGPFKFTSERDLHSPAFEVINVIGNGFRRVGFWSNHSRLSVDPPESLYSKPPNISLSSSQQLHGIIWPGQTTDRPRGWVFPNNGKQLRIGVPNRVSFREFVEQVPGDDIFRGYCIEVFTNAVDLLPYAVPYKFVSFGDGHTNPDDTEIVQRITTQEFDAAVGDIAITTNRTKMVDFTQPYIESGLVVVAPVKELSSSAWAFLRPFTPTMWAVTGAFFFIVGAVVWILEHRMNDDFRGPPRKQFITILWFSFSTLFFAHKENTVSTLGRIVLIVWLFVVLIINSSYTASLTSILTVQQLSSPVKGIESLLNSNDPIGYQLGSFARNYLVEELGIHESRLVPLNLPEDYVKALKNGPKNGGVMAVVDERAYMELFLSTHCEFSIVGQEFQKNGWGFAFPRDSPLAVDMSTAILKLSENGELQRIHDKWLMRSACTLQNTKQEVDRLELRSFSGLFAICAVACFLALLVYFILLTRQFLRYYSDPEPSSRGGSSRSARLQTFLSFVDEKEESAKSRSIKRKQIEGDSARSFDDEAYVNGSNSISRSEIYSNRA